MSMEVSDAAAAPRRRRKSVEVHKLPLREHKNIFLNQIPELAAQEGRRTPAKGTLEKMLSKAGREAGLSPRVAGYIGKRPVYEPQDVLDWLDSLVTAEPRTIGIADALKAKPGAPAPIATSVTDLPPLLQYATSVERPGHGTRRKPIAGQVPVITSRAPQAVEVMPPEPCDRGTEQERAANESTSV